MKARIYLIAALILPLAYGMPAFASKSAKAWYRGKTITIIVPSKPGGGYDTLARDFAPYLKKYLHLHSVSVINKAGGGQMIGSNAIYDAKPNGLTIGDTSAAGDTFANITGTKGAKFNAAKFSWLGRFDHENHIYITHPGGHYQNFSDLMNLKGTGKKLKVLAVGKNSAAYNTAVVTFKAFGIPYDMITGFSGSHAERATFLSGQGDTIAIGLHNLHKFGNKAHVILAMAVGKRLAQIPNVPTVTEEAKKYHVSKQYYDDLVSITNVMSLGHTFAGPPGIPKARLALLRKALKYAYNQPSFIKRIKEADVRPHYSSGQSIDRAVKKLVENKQHFLSVVYGK